jgi:predicted nucleic acid-binding protein
VTRVVLDASAGVELLLDSPAGERIQAQVPAAAEWWVPEHYFVEAAGALRRAVYRSAASEARVVVAFGRLATSPAHRVQVRPLLADAWSKRANLTIADALYVVLAEHLTATLVTADLKLAKSPAVTVPTITP